MKCLISGQQGFVGTRLTEMLKLIDIQVIGIPRFIYYAPNSLAQMIEKEKPDWIIHLASYGNMADQKDIMQTIQANILGTFNLLSAALVAPPQVFINVSSSSVLLDYETFYSATKAGAERLTKAFWNQFNLNTVTVRPYSLYGPNEAPFRFIPTIFRSCIQSEPMTLAPYSVHDWTYIDDFCEALIDIGNHSSGYRGQTIGIGTGKGTSNEDVVRKVELITGKMAKIKEIKEIRPFDTTDWKALSTDYICKTTLSEGLKKIYGQIKGNTTNI